MRYALYYAPPALSALWRLGCAWLGRDAGSGETPARPQGDIEASRIAAATLDAARYGWHATLKPPFALAAGTSEAMLEEALANFAASRAPFDGPTLEVRAFDEFLALRPATPCPELEALAADVVRDFDRYRAPASPAELARRRERGLTPRQEQYLSHWGYPWVLEEFQFHLTLTDRLPEDERARFARTLTTLLSPAIAAPLPVGELSLWVEEARGAAFRLHRRFGFGKERR